MTTIEYSPKKSKSASDIAWMLISKREYGLAILLALIGIVVGIRNFHFDTFQNAADMLTNASQTMVISCGVMLVIVTGEIDISVGSSMGLLTAILGTMVASPNPTLPGWGWPVWLGILLTLLAGTLIGLINGLLVTLVRVPSIIVTLAMLMALRSLAKMIMHKGDLDVPDSLHNFWGVGKFLGLPTPVWVMIVVTLCTWLMIRYTPIGRRIYAVGSNPHAATLSGISVSRVKIFTFAFTGFLVAVAAIITQQSTFVNGTGEGKELLVVTCIVVGGVSINGGVGTVLGVLLGALLLENQKTFLIFLDLGQGLSKWDKAIQGGLILAAVLIDHFASQRKRGQGGGAH